MNSKGSCSYVALGMLLSFYDTYWDDTVVSEIQEQQTELPQDQFLLNVESPGGEREPATIYNAPSTYSYLERCMDNATDYLHCNLISIGAEAECIDYEQDNLEQQISFTAGIDELEIVLQHYLSDNDLSQKLQIHRVTGNGVREAAVSLIKQGVPVVLALNKYESGVLSGHTVVAYDYDQENDEIYAHFGWRSDKTHTTLSSEQYDRYLGLITLLPMTSCMHMCTANYRYIDEQAIEIHSHCPCEHPIHPEYEEPDPEPDPKPEPDPDPEYPVLPPVEVHYHDEYWDVCADWHSYSCEACDLIEIEVPHEYVRYGANAGASNGTTHRKYCHCGYYVVEDHVVRASNDGSATFPAECMICGLIATGGSVAIVSIPITPEIMTMGTYTFSDGTTVQILTENGSYVLTSGIIVLVDEDADLVEAGLLDPYALVENLPTPSNPGYVTE